MLEQLKKDLKLYKNDLWIALAFIPVFFLLGLGCVTVIMFTSDMDTWVTLGTIGALFGMIMYFIICFMRYYQQFMLALSMGQTRMGFLFSYAVRSLLNMVLCYGLVLVLYRVELAVGAKLFAPWPLEVDPTFLMDWRLIAAVLVGTSILSMFIGALYSYFGKKAMAPLWFLWMAVCLGGPQLDSGRLAPVARILEAVPGWGWVLLGLAVLAAMAGTVIGLGKKQMVK